MCRKKSAADKRAVVKGVCSSCLRVPESARSRDARGQPARTWIVIRVLRFYLGCLYQQWEVVLDAFDVAGQHIVRQELHRACSKLREGLMGAGGSNLFLRRAKEHRLSLKRRRGGVWGWCRRLKRLALLLPALARLLRLPLPLSASVSCC